MSLTKEECTIDFNTHDTNLLSSNLFRRDQTWFTNKKNMEKQSFTL